MRPSLRWTNEHGSKVVHRTRWTALLHALRLNLKRWRRVAHTHQLWHAYPCRWGQQYREGEIATLHFHVGRRPRSER